jgi:predicted nuclease with RNAse H fold
MMHKLKYFAGIDVQINRGCCYYIIEQNKKYVASGWIKENIPQTLRTLLLQVSNNQPDKIAVGIDAPRMPITKLRNRYFDRKMNSWIEKPKQSFGRECEAIIKAYNIANPQWTKTLAESPQWMKLGYDIFSALEDFKHVYEVFPSASYKMLEKENLTYELCLNHFTSGIKDMLDASVAAITVYEFVNGRGCEVGGEDGLGTIVLPRRLEDRRLYETGSKDFI